MYYELFANYPDVLAVNDLCKMLRLGRNSVYDLVGSGAIKSKKIGKQYRISKIDVIEFFTDRSGSNIQRVYYSRNLSTNSIVILVDIKIFDILTAD